MTAAIKIRDVGPAETLSITLHMRDVAKHVRHGRQGSRTKPHRIARGERHGSKTKPERVARGESSGTALLTREQAQAAADLVSCGHSISSAARLLSLPRGAVKCIAQGKTWAHLERQAS